MELDEVGPPVPKFDPCVDKKAPSIFLVLNKVRAAVYRVGFNLWQIFTSLDPNKTCYVSDSKFISVLNGPLRDIIGLGSEEILRVADFFKIADGRIAYQQFCQAIHDFRPEPETEEDRKREDPYCSIELPYREEKRVLLCLTKIALTIRPRNILIRPFFQDYELMKKGSGLVSRNTFMRVLHFMGVQLSAEELLMFLRKYTHDCNTVKYNAFLKDLDAVCRYLEDNKYVDLSGNLLDQLEGGVPELEFPLYPRPEIRPVPRGPHHGIRKVFGGGWRGKALPAEVLGALAKVKDHAHSEKIRIRDFFITRDPKNCGRVSRLSFERLFPWLAVSDKYFNSMYFSDRDIDILAEVYRDPVDLDRIFWHVFEDDIEAEIDPEELACWPHRPLDRKPLDPFEVLKIHRPPPTPEVESLEETMYHFKEFTEQRKINMGALLAEYDTGRTSHISHEDLSLALTNMGIILTDRELTIIQGKYADELGFNWVQFLYDVNNIQYPRITEQVFKNEDAKKLSEEDELKAVQQAMESNVVEILAKIKRRIICQRVRMMDFLRPHDKHNHRLVSRADFLRSLDQCNLKLTKLELDTLMDVFSLPEDPDKIEYVRFCRTVDEESIVPCLGRKPLKEAMAYEAAKQQTKLPQHSWANFEARQVMSLAMEKLYDKISLGNMDLFKSLDTEKDGLVSRSQLIQVLYKLNTLHLLTLRQIDTIFEAFSIRKGLHLYLDYVSFLNALDIVFRTKKAAASL